MKIAFLHFDFCGGPQSANTEKILHGMKIAAAAGAEWILTPEMALQGYFMVKSDQRSPELSGRSSPDGRSPCRKNTF